MLKKNSVALLLLLLILTSHVFAQTGKPKAGARRRHAPPTGSNWTLVPGEVPNIVKPKKPGFAGEATDGHSIRRKQPRRHASSQSSAVVDNTIADGPQRVKAKKPGFIGGADDGQSIRRKQPHKHHRH